MESQAIEIIGWIGSILFAICALPQAWESIRNGHSTGINPYFMWMWLVGEVMSLIYVVASTHDEPLWPLIVNYGFNLILVLIIIKYIYLPRKLC